MTYSIENIKGEIGRGGGIAKANLFRVILPVIPEIYINTTGVDVVTPRSLDILCKTATMPGRQILTTDRTIGVVQQKVAYGYAIDDVNFTFIGLNNYVARKYFEDWQFYIMNPDTHEVRYKDTYAKTVTIQQLDMRGHVVYEINLEDAFPTQVLGVDFSNDNGQPVDISVTLSYTRWRRSDDINLLVGNVVGDLVSSIF